MQAPTRALAQVSGETSEAVLIVNTHSRHGRRLFAQARRLLGMKGIRLLGAYPIDEPEQMGEQVKACIDQGRKFIIVGGGDGTMSSIVDAFAYQDAVLGLLPLGTGNSFARTLELPLDLAGAIDVFLTGKVESVDLGRVNDDYFANVTSLGLSAVVARQISDTTKKLFGRFAYGLSGVRVFPFYQAFASHLESAEKSFDVETRQIVVANGRFHSGGAVAPDATIQDHRLVVFTLGGFSRRQLFKIWLAYQFGRHTILPESHYFTTQDVTITTDPPQYVDVDGEVTIQTPARFRVAPNALKVMVPANFTGKESAASLAGDSAKEPGRTASTL